MSVESKVRAVTTLRLKEMKDRGEKIAMLTSYDYSMAKIVDAAGVDVILVGDSAANVMAGYETTVPITLDAMIYHARSVVRAVERALVVVDLPFGTYQGNSKMALDSAIRIMKETEADAVKLEGGEEILESVERILTAGIPIMGHLGLTPQSIHKFGTYTVRAREEAEAEKLVSLGDMVTFTGPVLHYGEGRVAGRALDDRAGCAMLLAMIREELPCDCCFSFTVQEEVGCFGGKTAAYTLRPDIAIAVETTTAGDLAGVPEEKKVCRLGNGPVVSFMDRGTIYTYDLYKKVRALADENGIPNQTKEAVCGGNESRSLMTAAGGSEVLAISIPSRYLHSPACVADEKDIENTLELLRLLPEALAL